MSRWGQLQKGDLSIGVMRHDTRKHAAVVVGRGSVIHTIAYCRSDEEADRFWQALLDITDAADEREAA